MPYCSRCKSAVDDVRSHRCATNAATNTLLATNTATNKRLTHATNKSAVATNTDAPTIAAKAVREDVLRPGVEGPAVGPGVAVERPAVLPVGEGPLTANRRSRDAYNAYQREYMRKRRAKEV
jgi:hypothetical protein